MPLEPFNLADRVSFFARAIDSALDPSVHISQSSNFLLLFPEALREVGEALDAYKAEPTMAWKAVMPSFGRALYAISESVASNKIRLGAHDFMNHAQVLLPGWTTLSSPGNNGAQKAYVETNLSDIKIAISNALQNLTAKKYTDLLCDELNLELVRLANPRKIETRLDKIAREVAAHVSRQGRTGSVFSEAVRRMARNPSSFITAFRKLLQDDPRKHTVAVVIDNTRKILLSRQRRPKFRPYYLSDGAHGVSFALVPQNDLNRKYKNSNSDVSSGIMAQVPSSVQVDFFAFCMRHWKIEFSNLNPGAAPVGSTILTVAVDAWDAHQARHVALDAAEKLIDRINAEHRTSIFGVKRKVFVWRQGAQLAEVLSSPGQLVGSTRMANTNNHLVERSLRFASRASSERSGSMRTFFSWIALEYIGHGASNITPQNFVASRVPDVVSLVCLQRLVFDLWYAIDVANPEITFPEHVMNAIRRDGENSASHASRAPRPSQSKTFDASKLVSLVIADADHLEFVMAACGVDAHEAEMLLKGLLDYVAQLDRYSRYRFAVIRSTLREAHQTLRFVDDTRDHVDIALQRMRFVRNQTAHTGDFDSVKHLPLSGAAELILDATYQAVLPWSTTPIALDELSRRRQDLRLSLAAMSQTGYQKHALKFPQTILRVQP